MRLSRVSGCLAFAGFVLVLAGCTRTEPEPLAETTTGPVRPAESTAPLDESQAEDFLARYPIEFLDGDQLEGPTGLVLLVDDSIIDIDAGTEVRVTGLPDGEEFTFWSVSAGREAVVYVSCTECEQEPEVFSLDRGSKSAERIAVGFPAPGIGGVWVKRFVSGTRCALSKVSLDGTTLKAEKPIDCDLRLVGETGLGLVVWSDPSVGAVLDVDDLQPVFESGFIYAVVGDRVLSKDGDGFLMTNQQTGEQTRIASPTDIGSPSFETISPDGRYVSILFADPAWPGPRQRLDVWVLDMNTLEWTRLPSMPVAAGLKATGVKWAPDGRLVILGWFDEVGSAVVTWSPGDSRLSVREIPFETSQSLHVWCTLAECE